MWDSYEVIFALRLPFVIKARQALDKVAKLLLISRPKTAEFSKKKKPFEMVSTWKMSPKQKKKCAVRPIFHFCV